MTPTRTAAECHPRGNDILVLVVVMLMTNNTIRCHITQSYRFLEFVSSRLIIPIPRQPIIDEDIGSDATTIGFITSHPVGSGVLVHDDDSFM
jgi:hypothetical protein